MERRTFIRHTGLTLGALTFLGNHTFASMINDPAWKIRMLSDKFGIFNERGGTIGFLLSGDGVVVIDAQFPDTAPHLIEELKTRSKNPIRLLINTHHHADHTSGNIAFKGIVEHVVSHENSLANQKKVAVDNKTEDKQYYPDTVFNTSGWKEKMGKEHIKAHYFGPGHTNGDIMLHFQHANIVHMGDLVFNRRHPFIDKSAGADIANWIKILDKASNTFDTNTQFICGHAGTGYDVVAKTSDLLAFRNYLGNLLHFVDGQIKAGKTKDEILLAKEIPGSPEWKGDNLDRSLTGAYTELQAKLTQPKQD